MNVLGGNTSNPSCREVKAKFSPYLDGAMSGGAMASMARHLAACSDCSAEFAELRSIQSTLGSMGAAQAPVGLQARLRSAIAAERERGSHLSWFQRAALLWERSLRFPVMRGATGMAAALLLIGGVVTAVELAGVPTAVQANDEALGAVTAPHFLYSEVPPQPIEFGREVPVVVEAMIDANGRVYDYTILSGPTDVSIERRLQANLLVSRFQPATVFGQPVPGHVVMTFTGVAVRG